MTEFDHYPGAPAVPSKSEENRTNVLQELLHSEFAFVKEVMPMIAITENTCKNRKKERKWIFANKHGAGSISNFYMVIQ